MMTKPEQIQYRNLQDEMNLNEPRNIQPWKQLSFQCAKTVVFILNGFFWLLGWTLIGIGISLQGSNGDHRYLASNVYEDSVMNGNDYAGYSSASEFCLSIGCIIIVVVLLAFCGTHAENHLIFGIYLAVVVIFLSFEIGAIVVANLHKEKVEQRIIHDIKLTMELYEVKNFEGITNAIDSFQRVFHCCGCIDYTDWLKTTWGKHHKMNVPSSCQKNDSWNEEKTGRMIDISFTMFTIHKDGCFRHVRDYFVKNIHIFRTLIGWVLGIQIIGLAFSVCLFYKYKYHKTMIATSRYMALDEEQ